MNKKRKEIYNANQLVNGKKYFLEQENFVVLGTFWETKPYKEIDTGSNVFVPNEQPSASIFPLSVMFKDRFELFKELKAANIQIYEDLS